MKKLILTVALLATGSQAMAFDLTDKELVNLDRNIVAIAGGCSQFGYTEIHKDNTAEYRIRKVKTALILDDLAEFRLTAVGKALIKFNANVEEADAIADRMADFLLVADGDPESHSAAKAKYVDYVMSVFKPLRDACSKVYGLDYVSKYYMSFTGDNSAEMRVILAERFDSSVSSLAD